MSLEKFENFGELHWDDDQTEVMKKKSLNNKQKIIVGIIIFIGLVLTTYGHIYNKTINASSEFTWLNRCNTYCQRVTNIKKINQMSNCIALENLYKEQQTNYMFEWRIAVDDKSSSLGCPNFPKTMNEIMESIKIAQQKITEAKQKNKTTIGNELNNIELNQQQRFLESLQDGNLQIYIITSNPSPKNQNELLIVVNKKFTDVPLPRQKQLSRIFWQKWANITSPGKSMKATIILVDEENVVLGTSDANDTSNIIFTNK